ncbi:hypothetical protein [Halolamina sp.]|uniref:hypothetical protein n=1 Tax=Halolamina sp. TaxID=1940283 RepID=UPI003567D3DE
MVSNTSSPDVFWEAFEFLVHRLDLDLAAALGELVLEHLFGLPFQLRLGSLHVGDAEPERILRERAFNRDRHLAALEEFLAGLEELCDSARFVNYPAWRLQNELSDALAKKGREEGPHDVTIVRSFVDNLLTA